MYEGELRDWVIIELMFTFGQQWTNSAGKEEEVETEQITECWGKWSEKNNKDKMKNEVGRKWKKNVKLNRWSVTL